MKKRIGRPSASVTACSLVFMPPLVQPIRRPRWSPGPPLFDRRLVAVRCAFRYLRRQARTNGACLLTSIITVFGTAVSETRPSIIRAKMPLSPHRFQRL